MAKEKLDLREALQAYKYDFDLLQRIPCNKEENLKYRKLVKDGAALPNGVHAVTYEGGDESQTAFYTVYEPDLTEAEVREYLQFKQLGYIKTIKNCVVFFTVLTIIGMIASFLIMLNGF